MTGIKDVEAAKSWAILRSTGKTTRELQIDLSRAVNQINDGRLRDEFSELLRGMIECKDLTPDSAQVFLQALGRGKDYYRQLYRNVPGYEP